MVFRHLLLFLSVISAGHIIRSVSALSTEGIVNGIFVNQPYYFPHHVAILKINGPGQEPTIRCNGALVATGWILSVTHCFMVNSIGLRAIRFTAVMGTVDVSDPANGFPQDIIYIYTYKYAYSDEYHDVTMAKPRNNFRITNTVQTIAIPHSSESSIGDSGFVSGYGSYGIVTVIDEYNHQYDYENNPDFLMRYTSVTVTEADNCYDQFPFTDSSDKFCGLAEHIEGNYTGMCSNDAGSPLVIFEKVVGLSVTSYEDCDDTTSGSLYLDTARHYDFINDIINNNISPRYRKLEFNF